jgi:hypothetical protein
MNHRNSRLTWLLFGGFSALLAFLLGGPASVRATPFASPTPAATTINQPYVTFQNPKVVQRFFRFDDGIPIYLVLLILIVLLGLVALYLTSFRPKH